ncbi:MAG: cytochrome c [Spirosomaceae bacterium]|nr:cytochrome c [Spirosomataceae bacterium]
MKKITIIALVVFIFGSIFIMSCSKEAETPAPVKVTYNKDIKAIFTANCTPCHLAGGTNPNKWDDYTQAKAKITAILDRVQRQPGTTGFMPRNGTMQLPQATIDKLKQWVSDGLLEN